MRPRCGTTEVVPFREQGGRDLPLRSAAFPKSEPRSWRAVPGYLSDHKLVGLEGWKNVAQGVSLGIAVVGRGARGRARKHTSASGEENDHTAHRSQTGATTPPPHGGGGSNGKREHRQPCGLRRGPQANPPGRVWAQ
jgi:hypothetical protein